MIIVMTIRWEQPTWSGARFRVFGLLVHAEWSTPDQPLWHQKGKLRSCLERKGVEYWLTFDDSYFRLSRHWIMPWSLMQLNAHVDKVEIYHTLVNGLPLSGPVRYVDVQYKYGYSENFIWLCTQTLQYHGAIGPPRLMGSESWSSRVKYG